MEDRKNINREMIFFLIFWLILTIATITVIVVSIYILSSSAVRLTLFPFSILGIKFTGIGFWEYLAMIKASGVLYIIVILSGVLTFLGLN